MDTMQRVVISVYFVGWLVCPSLTYGWFLADFTSTDAGAPSAYYCTNTITQRRAAGASFALAAITGTFAWPVTTPLAYAMTGLAAHGWGNKCAAARTKEGSQHVE